MKVNAWASLSVVMSLRILTSQRFFSLTTTEFSDLSSVSGHCNLFDVQDQEGKIQVYWKILSIRLHRKGDFISNLFLMFASFYQEDFSLYSSRSYKLRLNLAVVSWKELLEEYSKPIFYRNNIIIWGVVCFKHTEQFL